MGAIENLREREFEFIHCINSNLNLNQVEEG